MSKLILSNRVEQKKIANFLSFFSGEECLGSARIERVGPSHYSMDVNNCRTILDKKRKESSSFKSDKSKNKPLEDSPGS